MELPLGSDLARLVRVWRSLIDFRLKPLELTQTHWVTLHNIPAATGAVADSIGQSQLASSSRPWYER